MRRFLYSESEIWLLASVSTFLTKALMCLKFGSFVATYFSNSESETLPSEFVSSAMRF